MKKTLITIIFLLVFLAAAGAVLAAMTSSNYQIWSDDFSIGGGEDQATNNYKLTDTLGELGIGHSAATNYEARIGFREIRYFRGEEVLTLSISTGSLELGTMSQTAAKTANHTLTVDTNSDVGVSVTFSGSTLTCSLCSGNNTVAAIGASGAASLVGTSQFGFNAIYSSGTSPAAASVSPYNVSGQYAFQSGDKIISSTGQINATTFNINYIANISGSEPAGTYTTTITYTATANF